MTTLELLCAALICLCAWQWKLLRERRIGTETVESVKAIYRQSLKEIDDKYHASVEELREMYREATELLNQWQS